MHPLGGLRLALKYKFTVDGKQKNGSEAPVVNLIKDRSDPTRDMMFLLVEDTPKQRVEEATRSGFSVRDMRIGRSVGFLGTLERHQHGFLA